MGFIEKQNKISEYCRVSEAVHVPLAYFPSPLMVLSRFLWDVNSI